MKEVFSHVLKSLASFAHEVVGHFERQSRSFSKAQCRNCFYVQFFLTTSKIGSPWEEKRWSREKTRFLFRSLTFFRNIGDVANFGISRLLLFWNNVIFTSRQPGAVCKILVSFGFVCIGQATRRFNRNVLARDSDITNNSSNSCLAKQDNQSCSL